MFGTTRKTLTRDPWLEFLYNLERRMGRVDPLAFNWQTDDVSTAAWTPVVDIFEEADTVRIVAEIPGVKPEDVKISVQGNLLTIQGVKEQETEEKTEKVHRFERLYGSFERTFSLPASVDAERIKARYAMGLLTLTLPKVEKAKPRHIAVEISPSKQLKG